MEGHTHTDRRTDPCIESRYAQIIMSWSSNSSSRYRLPSGSWMKYLGQRAAPGAAEVYLRTILQYRITSYTSLTKHSVIVHICHPGRPQQLRISICYCTSPGAAHSVRTSAIINSAAGLVNFVGLFQSLSRNNLHQWIITAVPLLCLRSANHCTAFMDNSLV